jgi:long-subunit acyl-CoA synthetase (AMP-forming)
MQLIDSLRNTAAEHARRPALIGDRASFNYAEMMNAVGSIARELQARRISTLGLYANNGPNWLLVDLACQAAGITLVPLPGFFSEQQLAHTLRASGIQALLTDNCERFTALDQVGEASAEIASLALVTVVQKQRPELPAQTGKITFTSGSTGTPRGVCLADLAQYTTAMALCEKLAMLNPQRHLCVLPLATLLENVAGAYASWLSGGTVIAPGLENLGLCGSSQLDIGQLCRCIDEQQPQSLILLPQILKELVQQIEQKGWRPPRSLTFAAVGGGKVSAELLLQARKLGLPAYEGYGLSECGSVVTLNLPGADRPGSAGRPLSHCEIKIQRGEVLVRGPRYLGYLDEPGACNEWLATGDLGEFDSDGYLQLTGRRKNILISSYGRNISPEWIESELLLTPLLMQCVLLGDGRSHCSALIVSRPGTGREQIEQWLETVNRRLPDYARVRRWAPLPQPLTFAGGLLTANGRPRRDAIAEHYSEIIENLYQA